MSATALEAPLTLDRRRAPRERLLQRARILVDERPFDCILLDLTPTGARVETTQPLNLPDRFILCFGDGRQYVCERRWRSGQRMGLMFLRPNQHSDRRERAGAIRDMLGGIGRRAVFDMLRDDNYLDSQSLGDAAWLAEEALRTLDETLRAIAEGQDEGAAPPS